VARNCTEHGGFAFSFADQRFGIAICDLKFGGEMKHWFLVQCLVNFSFVFFFQKVTEPPSMDQFRFFTYRFSSIPVWMGSVQQFSLVFGFFSTSLVIGLIVNKIPLPIRKK